MNGLPGPRHRAARFAATAGVAAAALWIALAATAEVVDPTTEAAAPGIAPAAMTDATEAADRLVAERVERGRYLATLMACGDCHTPWVMGPEGPHPDATRLLSGHPQDFVVAPAPAASGPWVWQGAASNTAFAGPWGISYATNLTPDENTGLGIWSEEIFVRAIRTGRHFGQSRPIMPPMPWESFRHATDEDLASIYAYLRSIPPVHNRVPDYAPPGGDGEDLAALME